MFKLARIANIWNPFRSFEEIEKSEGINWIATDKDGSVFSFSLEPYILEFEEQWECQRGDREASYMGKVEYTGDWKDSLRYVGDK